tara:strand:- start:585 stop:998 length:414 start_codon:yes stop_codon:yes gene_type:complete
MERIVSFDDFKKKATEIVEDDNNMEGGKQHYMFFANLTSIKHYIEEILKMDPEEVDNHLKNGHDWAADHIATSKDDIQEVADWIRNEIEGDGSSEESGEEMIDPENIEVEVEDDEKPEVEDGEKEEGEEDEDEEDEE